ncbi:phage holin family protein [Draconibacterium orientale]|uniref:phage holin family protein n=1 Tax=Draconibacterium orientale TaxID=1168034 RepID=UPI0029C0E7F0|nr:phage holin family protein [Draconibacterium orientale]
MTRTLNYLLFHGPNIWAGLFTAVAGYFAPIRGTVAVVLAAIIVDLAFGIWAARIKGEGIKSKKLWRTGYKIFITFMLINLMHSIDKEMGIPGIVTSKIVALFITGFEIWSILESAAVITDHPVFRYIKRYMESKVKDKTGIEFKQTSHE